MQVNIPMKNSVDRCQELSVPGQWEGEPLVLGLSGVVGVESLKGRD